MPFTELTSEDMETMDREELIDQIIELQDMLSKETDGSEKPRDTEKKN